VGEGTEGSFEWMCMLMVVVCMCIGIWSSGMDGGCFTGAVSLQRNYVPCGLEGVKGGKRLLMLMPGIMLADGFRSIGLEIRTKRFLRKPQAIT